MRTIKFRAWDSENNHFEFSHDPSRIESNQDIENFALSEFFEYYHDFKIDQFTGLLDKNGKEIYEGDIVKDTHEASAKGKVVFINGAFRIEYEGGRGGYDISHRLYYKPEVIGNIHEI